MSITSTNTRLQMVIDYCSAKQHTTKGFPFDEETLVFKVHNKMFALLNLTPPYRLNVKCEPLLAIALREKYTFVLPGYHMNKKHWNTIDLGKTVDEKKLKDWIDMSYNLILESLPRSQREQ